jgi:hypothetical protein
MWHLQSQKGPAHVKPPSLEIDNHQMWPTTVIPDLEEGAASQSQVQMSGSGARPLRRSKLKKNHTNKAKQRLHIVSAETFVVEDPNDTSSDGDIVEEAHGDSDYEMVDAEEEPSGVSEAMALEVSAAPNTMSSGSQYGLQTPLWQDSEHSEEVPDNNHGIDHIVASVSAHNDHQIATNLFFFT